MCLPSLNKVVMFVMLCQTLPSMSASFSMSVTSASFTVIPRPVSAAPSSLAEIVPSPFLSNKLKASAISVKKKRRDISYHLLPRNILKENLICHCRAHLLTLFGHFLCLQKERKRDKLFDVL